jgi:crooked neck
LTVYSLCILTVPDKAREVFQTALEFFGDEEEQVEKAQAVFGAFARMETRLKEFERARVIYKFALARLPRSKSANRTSHHPCSRLRMAN